MKLQEQHASPSNRFLRVLMCIGFLFWGALPAHAGGDGTCDSPVLVQDEARVEFQFDTRLWTNNENAACVDSLATGPDIVLICNFGCANGVVSWTADYDAVVYIRGDDSGGSCEAPCRRSSTAGETWFDSNWRWERDGVHCDLNYIVVDGLNGSAGLISLVIDTDSSNPVYDEGWGQIKARFR